MHPMRSSRVLFALVGLIVFGVVLLCGRLAGAESRPEAPEARSAWLTASVPEVDAAIQEMLAAVPRHHLMRDDEARAAMAQTIVAQAEARGVPPLLVVRVIFLESSFDERAVGKRGELGLMQVAKRNVRIYQCDMSTADGQVACGVGMLRDGFDECGSWRGALTRYATTSGACASDDPNVTSKVNYRLRGWQHLSLAVDRRMREQGDEE